MGKLTEDEHRARAMLMGYNYQPWAHAYTGITPAPLPLVWLDADTLEPLDLNQISLRIQETLDKEPTHDFGLDWGTRDGRRT